MASPTISVVNYHLNGYARTWRGTVLSSFVMPVLFVVGFGISVGSLVNAGGRLGGGLTYLQFIAPGMIASTALQLAFGEATWPALSRFEWNRIYESMAATPLRIRDILGGDILFMLFRIVTTSAVFLGVTALFGAIQSWWGLLVPLICGLLGISFAAPMFALTGAVKTGNAFAFIGRFLVIPMTLFAGVFFPVSALHEGVRWLAYISPLWHGVQLCRAATSTDHGSLAAAAEHVAYLLLWALVGGALAYRSFTRRLAD
ncbi:MAG TPA: ABC transporter permease [Micromonosporaceae bacterium]